MPKLRQITAPPQKVEQLLNLPLGFPELPASVRDRFGADIDEYKKSSDQFWLRVKRTLSEAYSDATQPQNELAKKVDGIQQAIFQGATGDFTALIDEERTIRATQDSALASIISTVEATLTSVNADLDAKITTERTARVTADAAIASLITAVDAAYQAADVTINASITTEQTARAAADSALATRTTTLESQVQTPTTGVLARVTIIESTYATQTFAIAKKAEAITASNGYTDSSITTESTARIAADSALSTRIDTISASAGAHVFFADDPPVADGPNDLWFDTNDGKHPYYWSGTAWLDNTDGRLAGADARITAIESAYASTSYVAASISTAITAALVSANGYTDAQITSLSSVYATPTYVNATISTAISAEVTNRNNAISTSAASLTTAYTTADSALNVALGGRITTLEGQVQTPTIGALARISTVEQISAGGRNVLTNSMPAIGSSLGWFQGGDTTTLPTDFGQCSGVCAFHLDGEASIYRHQIGTPAAGTAFDIYFGADAFATRYAVKPGARYEFSIYAGAQRCSVQLQIYWFDAAGASISVSSGTALSGANGGLNLSDWLRPSVFGTAPAGAVRASPVIHAVATGVADPYLFACRAYFGEAQPLQSVPSPWSGRDDIAVSTASRTTTLESQVQTPTTGALARITQIESTYATTTGVGTLLTTAMTAEVTNRNAAISASSASLTTAYTTADAALNTALGGRINTLESQVQTPTTGLLARVTTVESTYATTSAVSAILTSAISAEISNRNAAISASVSSEASARASADGNLEGQYLLRVVAGNVVTGMKVTSTSNPNAGDTSEIIFDTASFKISNGGSTITPFSVSGGTVYMNNVVITGDINASSAGGNVVLQSHGGGNNGAFFRLNDYAGGPHGYLEWDVGILKFGGNDTTLYRITAGVVETNARFNAAGFSCSGSSDFGDVTASSIRTNTIYSSNGGPSVAFKDDAGNYIQLQWAGATLYGIIDFGGATVALN